MVIIPQMVSVSHVTATLLVPIIVFVIRPAVSVVVSQTSRVVGAMQHKLDSSLEHLTISDLKQKTLPIQRYLVAV